MLSNTPHAHKEKNSAVPPWLTNMSGRPESGKIPSIDAMFKNDCATIIIAIPSMSSPPNVSLILKLIYIDLPKKSRKKATKNVAPIKPNSSDATANIESPIGSGK